MDQPPSYNKKVYHETGAFEKKISGRDFTGKEEYDIMKKEQFRRKQRPGANRKGTGE
jgi:hypothetical protein